MQTFCDDQQRTWNLAINIGLIRRVRTALGERNVDLLKIDEGQPGQPPLVARLSVDVELLVDVIWVLVKDTPQPAPVDDEAFVLAMGGDGMPNAAAAFWREMRDFFQKLGRKDLVQVIQTQMDLLTGTVEKQTAEYAAIDLTALIDETWEQEKAKRKADQPTPGNESTNSPGSPESSPAPSRSAN